jgi:predicted nuclease of restriction endonuclease-like (RecB) superfamily
MGKKSIPRHLLPEGYAEFLLDLKRRIKESQLKAAISANTELILLYWDIGKEILERQDKEGWGAKIIDRLSTDLKQEFPRMKGFSPRNLKYMRAFAQNYPEREFVQEVFAQITWYHNIAVFEKIKEPAEREWYIHKIVEHGWSRNILVHQIESGLYHRQGKGISNFSRTLPSPQSDLARQTLKDPYLFDFLMLESDAEEREIERQLTYHITKFLLELGAGFAFIGQQYPIEVSGNDYYIDLLFYHLKLRCYVVIELKGGKFKPEYAGKLNFYLSAVDDLVKDEKDNPSIGIILCKTKDKVLAEYSLRDINKPIGVSDYQLTHAVPEELKSSLPSVEELESELAQYLDKKPSKNAK